MRFRSLLCALVLFPAVAVAQFDPTKLPVSPDGTAATIDLPAALHVRNVGGSDGAGLCVFTSIQHAAYWQNVRTLDGFRAWMEERPGGGWPDKVDRMFAQFCKSRGAAVPPYIQHTGGDDTFLALALKTDRLPCVTYAGMDDFYRDERGRPAKIAHMVNLAHLDTERAAIIDNNRPGVWVWMTRARFLARWRDNSGGWAVVMLAPPPPPHPSGRPAGDCPAKCPVQSFGQPCPNGRCPFPARPSAPAYQPCPGGLYNAPTAPGEPPSDAHEWRQWDDGDGYGWRLKIVPEAKPEATGDNFGVASDKIHSHPEYSLAGRAITKSHAHALLAANGLADDSDHWHLSAVGTADLIGRFAADAAALPPAVRDTLHTQTYAPDHWAVAMFDLPPGVNLRRPSPGRTAADVGTVAPADYSAAALAALLAREGGPTYAPPPVAPHPVPPPKIDQPEPVVPAPVPVPVPPDASRPAEPAPAPAGAGASLWAILASVFAILASVWRRPA